MLMLNPSEAQALDVGVLHTIWMNIHDVLVYI